MPHLIRNLIKTYHHHTGKPYKGVFKPVRGTSTILRIQCSHEHNPIDIDLDHIYTLNTSRNEALRDNILTVLERNLGGYGDELYTYVVNTAAPIQEAQAQRARRIFSALEEKEEHNRSTRENMRIHADIIAILHSAKTHYKTYYNYKEPIYSKAQQKDLDTVSPHISYAEAVFFVEVAHAIFLISPNTYTAFETNTDGLRVDDAVSMSRDVRGIINYYVQHSKTIKTLLANRLVAGDTWDYPIKDLGIQPVPNPEVPVTIQDAV